MVEPKIIYMNRLTKKLDVKHAKYKVNKAVRSHTYQLNTLLRVKNVFNNKLLCLASFDPLPS